MNKEKKLTWKYFLKQKTKEISIGIIICLAIIFIPYYLGYVIGDNMDINCGGGWYNAETELTDEFSHLEFECTNFEIWGEGLFYTLIASFIIFIIRIWLISNWEKAEKKAKKELKIKK